MGWRLSGIEAAVSSGSRNRRYLIRFPLYLSAFHPDLLDRFALFCVHNGVTPDSRERRRARFRFTVQEWVKVARNLYPINRSRRVFFGRQFHKERKTCFGGRSVRLMRLLTAMMGRLNRLPFAVDGFRPLLCRLMTSIGLENLESAGIVDQ